VILQRLFGRKKPDISAALYASIVAAARQEKFYAQWRVPDTLDGRFDMLVLHVFLVLNRLKDFGAIAEPLRQALTDRFFADMDSNLREMGVGDLGVGKKVRKMAESFFGRVTAYDASLGKPGDELSQALVRNVFAGADATHAPALANWTKAAHKILASQDLVSLSAGDVRFTP
jgi:cytochrome b pre-mRNA-processing protein 3